MVDKTMHLTEVILITFGLSTNLFVLALNNAMEQEHYSPVLMFRMIWMITLFQAVFMAVGWFIGQATYYALEHIRFVLAFFIFSILGVKMIWEAFRVDPRLRIFDLARSNILLAVATAAGFTALVAGAGMNLGGIRVVVGVVAVTVMTFIIMVIGSFIGRKYGCRFRGKFAKATGGILLTLIGIKYLLEFRGITL
jgi:putative Mn2+ efflux pump MntP